MSAATLTWAWEQRTGWPLAKLLLVLLADDTSDGTAWLSLDPDEASKWCGADGSTEIMAALTFLVERGLLHMQPVTEGRINVRPCDPQCFLCEKVGQ